MFTIRQLYTVIAVIYTLLLLAGIITMRVLWFFPAEYDDALAVQQSEVNGLISALALKRNQLEAVTQDYATWDDTFEYAAGDNPEYTDENFIPDTFDAQSLNAVVIVNPDSDILYGGFYAGEDIHALPDELAEWTRIASNEFFSNQVASGFQTINERIYLIASSPITPTGESNPIGGWLLFMQAIDNNYLTVLAEVARLNMTLKMPPYSVGSVNLKMPIKEVMAIRQGCLFDDMKHPSLCVNLRHSNGSGPQMFSSRLLLTLLIFSLIPAALFLTLLNLLIDPISKATKLLERSNSDHTLHPILYTTPVRILELRQLRNAYNELVHTIRQQQARLEQLSNTDRLTNIPNRRAFDEVLETSWRRMLRHSHSVALVLVDIDYFKRFNDHYGHQTGDMALHQVAQALHACARRADEMASRFGGEEFALILQADDARSLDAIRTRLHTAISNLHIPHGYSAAGKELTVSIGIAWVKDSGQWLESIGKEEWLRAADTALYEAKAAGRNTSMLQVLSEEIPLTESPVLSRLPDSL